MKFLILPKVGSVNGSVENFNKKREKFVCEPLCLSVCENQVGMKELKTNLQGRIGCCPQGGRMPR